MNGDAADRIERLLRGEIGELGPAEFMELARLVPQASGVCGLRSLRVALLSTFSLGFIEPYLVVEGARRGLAIRSYYGGFGQFEQELADSEGELARFEPELLVLAMRPEDFDPDAVVRYLASGGRRFAALADELLERLVGCVRLFRARSTAPVLVANFAPPADLPLGVFDANVAGSLSYALAGANQRLQQVLGAEDAAAAVWDFAGLVRSQGAADWTDRRLAALARAPVAARHQPACARHLVRSLHALLQPPARCLVLDLDNTLWGGAIGDDGIEGIQLGDDHPGVAYKWLQRAALALRDRGILLAVASKNDRETVEQAFREHPEMLIRWQDLAAVRIDWEPKSKNLIEIARELDLGVDALVLFDDNPVERAEVRANAPEVRVIEVPTDPLQFETALANCGHFDSPALTREDAVRAEVYRRENERRRLRAKAGSLEDFLRDLDMQATVGHLGPSTLQRIAQLVAKTNQFNLTTRRRGAAELEAMAKRPDHAVTWLRLRDRYGEAGLVAVGVLRREDRVAVIDTFLMSCRVMGRRVEQALLAHLAGEARRLGCSQLFGDYLPTQRNAIVRNFYPDAGFAPQDDLPGGGRRFALDLAQDSPEWPELIRRAAESDPAAAPVV